MKKSSQQYCWSGQVKLQPITYHSLGWQIANGQLEHVLVVYGAATRSVNERKQCLLAVGLSGTTTMIPWLSV